MTKKSDLKQLFPLKVAPKSRFKIGDPVRLLTGSPTMTVVDFDGDQITTCWKIYGGPKVEEATWKAADLTKSLSFYGGDFA